MASRLQILSNVVERLKCISGVKTGHLYGVIHDNTLLVLTFTLNTDEESDNVFDHTVFQLNMPTGIYLCGILCIGDCKNDIHSMFKNIDIIQDQLLIKCPVNSSEIQTYFYTNQELELCSHFEIINEDDFKQQFSYVRLQGSFPLLTQDSKIMDMLKKTRTDITSGKVAMYFPLSNVYLFSSDNNVTDITLKELLCALTTYEGSTNTRNTVKYPTEVVDAVCADMFLKISESESSLKCKYAPVLHHIKQTFIGLECTLNIDSLSLVNHNINCGELYTILLKSVCRNIKLIETSIEAQLKKSNSSIKLPKPIHFNPKNCGCFITLAYEDGSSNNETLEYRKALHKALVLDMTKPYFRSSNSIKFRNDVEKNNVLLNPHLSLPDDKIGELSIVDGLYSYHHYMQDDFDDNGWGCAYRSLQTIVSWYRLQGYADIPIPSHLTIQKCLVDIGDKPTTFIGSKQWIGSSEVGFVLETLLGINVKILCASSGEEVSTLATDLAYHFQKQGTPVMIGGGVLAHTILGINYNNTSGEVKFLILDPHYTGTEQIHTIINKGWCGWKTSNFWKKDSFYNMCLPQRPICI